METLLSENKAKIEFLSQELASKIELAESLENQVKEISEAKEKIAAERLQVEEEMNRKLEA